jgi:hypothetical protein
MVRAELVLRCATERAPASPGIGRVASESLAQQVLEAGMNRAKPTFEEAAETVTYKDYTSGEFLDGAALAAQTLELEDLAAHLERA